MPTFAPDTRERVSEAIEALGYRPNLTARSLRGGRTGVIALAVPDLTSPYFAEIAEGVIDAAEELGWTVLIDQTDGRRERELLVLHGIRDHLIDGVIFSPLALDDDDLRTTRSEVPIVCLGGRSPRREHGSHRHRQRRRRPHRPRSTSSNTAVAGSRPSARSSPPSAETARLRLAGYTEALAEAGLPLDPTMVQPAGGWHRADGFAVSVMQSAHRPDAIFCFNDLLALGALHGLARARRACARRRRRHRHRRHRGGPVRATHVDDVCRRTRRPSPARSVAPPRRAARGSRPMPSRAGGRSRSTAVWSCATAPDRRPPPILGPRVTTFVSQVAPESMAWSQHRRETVRPTTSTRPCWRRAAATSSCGPAPLGSWPFTARGAKLCEACLEGAVGGAVDGCRPSSVGGGGSGCTRGRR